jgi:histidinol-phosphate phosphatase family protein
MNGGDKKSPAVFLDRDGTIIEYEEVPDTAEKIRSFPFSGPAIKKLNDLGYLVIVHTNQPIIEKGVVTQAESDELDEVMKCELAKSGARIDAVYTCPHRYVEGREDRCRKPEPGLIEQAQADFSIDMSGSWLVGDTTRDMETGKRLGLKTILVATGDGGRDTQFFQTKGDYEAEDLLEAVKIVEQAVR